MDQYVSLFFVQVKFGNYSLLIGNKNSQQHTQKGIANIPVDFSFFKVGL